MRTDAVSKANAAYRAGAYEDALRLYHELGSELGHELFYGNVALCLDRLNVGRAAIEAACLRLAAGDNADILRDLYANDVVVSLTSFPGRIESVADTLESLLAQTLRPGKLVLWLAEEQFPHREGDLPVKLLQLKNRGLEIEWCEDIRSYKKLVPALRMYSDRIIVTADDDLIYSRTWLAELLITHIQDRDSIVCHRSHGVTFDGDGSFAPYKSWPKEIVSGEPSFAHLCTSGAGVLYPPGSLHEAVLEADRFMSICPTGDDLWFWTMAVLNGTKVRIVKDSSFRLEFVPGTQEEALWIGNVSGGGNDRMLKELSVRYPEVHARVWEECVPGSASEPQISVIIPVFNTGSYLADCLDSILSQDLRNFEVLCIDDGSTCELTNSILSRYSERDLRVQVIRQKNSGPATARNLGLRNARGEYVTFVDSDDYISTAYLGELYRKAKQSGANIVAANRILLVAEDKTVQGEKRSGFELFGKVSAKQLAAGVINATGVSCNKLYKKSFLSSNGISYLDGMRCQSEDNYFSILAMVLGHESISIAKNSTYYYRQHDGGITKNITKDGFDKSVLVYEEVKDKLAIMGVHDEKFWLNVVNQRALRDLRLCARNLEGGGDIEDLLVGKFSCPIDICCIADANYVVPTMVFLESVKRTKRRATVPSITVLAPRGARGEMAILESLSDSDFMVEVREVDSSQFENLHKYKEKDDFVMASPSAMFKFIIPSLYPELDRILYIDTDLIIRKDLFELFMMDIEDKYLCAVPDLWTPVTDREDIRRFASYFNSGVMLMNLSRMRDEGLPVKLIETKRSTTNFNLMDQDVFNEVCANSVKVLDIKFNFLPVCYKRHRHRFDLNAVNKLYGSNYASVEEISLDPVVAHWAGSEKPWVTTDTLYADEWMNIYVSLDERGFLDGEHLRRWASRQESLKSGGGRHDAG